MRQLLCTFRATHIKQHLQVGEDCWEHIVGGSGSQTIFIVGGGGSGVESMFSINAALESCAQVISFCIPTSAATPDRVTDGILAIMDSLQLRHAVFLGHSLGGLIIQSFAVRHPQRIAGLVLANTGFYLGVRAWALPAFVALMARLPQALLRRMGGSQMDRLLKPVPAASFWQQFYRNELTEPDAGARLKHQGILMLNLIRFFRVHPISPALPWTQSLPVAIIASQDDRGFTPRETAYLGSLYQQSETTVLPVGTGHLSFLTRPDDYVRLVQQLIVRASTQPSGSSNASSV
jgi:pimeloyl-ACP methyl ester carboxylesterase